MRSAARTAAVYAVPAAAIVIAWLRIEGPPRAGGDAVILALVALAPALVGGLRLRLAVLAGSLLVGTWIALGASFLTPGRMVTRLWDGAREFYDVDLPFDPTAHPRMQGAALLALFVFCLLLGLALAARRALLAVGVLALGAGWPGTLVWGGRELLLGGLILAGALVILAGLRPRARSAFYPAIVAGALVVAAALGLASRPAVAKQELLHWQGWDLYTQADRAVGVSYVWDSNYNGLDWPKKRTVVLKIEAPDEAFYWRATTLDAFVGDNWKEDLESAPAPSARPPRRRGLVRQVVTVEALRDTHLVGAERPVAFSTQDTSTDANGRVPTIGFSPEGEGQTYVAWSSVQRPSPEELARSKPIYPTSIGVDIGVDKGVTVPSFGTPGRDAVVHGILAAYTTPYTPLYAAAKEIVGHVKTPYAAVVAIESWLRDSGRFTYDQHPPQVAGVPPLVAFVTETHRGYCQHFAGAMALMLRYLGIPARVAAGFASGTYSNGQWTLTDHDAHAWVEVWFRGYGWLPFDPTPGRGSLGAAYSRLVQELRPWHCGGAGRGGNGHSAVPAERGLVELERARGARSLGAGRDPEQPPDVAGRRAAPARARRPWGGSVRGQGGTPPGALPLPRSTRGCWPRVAASCRRSCSTSGSTSPAARPCASSASYSTPSSRSGPPSSWTRRAARVSRPPPRPPRTPPAPAPRPASCAGSCGNGFPSSSGSPERSRFARSAGREPGGRHGGRARHPASAADRALAQARPSGGRPAGDRHAPARARGGRLRLLRRRHRASGRAGGGTGHAASLPDPPRLASRRRSDRRMQSGTPRSSRRFSSPPPTPCTRVVIRAASGAPSRKAARPAPSRSPPARAPAANRIRAEGGRVVRVVDSSDESGFTAAPLMAVGLPSPPRSRPTSRDRPSSWPPPSSA